MATMRSAVRHFSLAIGVPQKPDWPRSSGWSSCRQPLPISVCATGTSSASASAVRSAVARADSTPPPAYSTGRSAAASASTMRAAVAGSRPCSAISGGTLSNASDREVGREDVHRDVDEHRSRTSGLREVERALHDARQVLDAIDAIHALAERPEDLELIRVLVQVDLLMRMAAVVVRRDVAGDHDHRDRVERGVGDAGRGVGEARARDASARRRPCRRPARSRRPRAPRSARAASRRSGCGSCRARRETR